MSFLPSDRETCTLAPMPISMPNAVMMIMMGKTAVTPLNASAPTAWPIKIRSMML
ncbi:MAG: hypothetical protein BWX80_03674 [Candidatus Hydrogenedentes bacterium ADurb.Bin101]|nr:MAG: hypothetical protein BWX80_03674 [Candidatus Hydrogenedentes bacterium ADurb.Bin101]